ncbi:MAG: hypothetical protein HOK72_02630 [Flavobacteriales bacterium]|jgi:hypothetical protein|nr:hypothetical protein [Flavobacteriales bacterium]
MQRILILSILLFSILTCFSQTKQATKNEALLYMLIVNKDDKPIEEKIIIHSVKTKKDYSVNSNSVGIAEILLPKNDTYIINLEFEPNYDKILIPDDEFYSLNYKIFYDKDRLKKAANSTIHFELLKANGSPLSEEITLVSEKTNLKYSLTTNEKGKSDITIPNNDTYLISMRSAPDYARLEVPNVLNYEMNYSLLYEGSYEEAVYPSLTKALFTFKFYNLDSVLVPHENFYLVSKKNGKVYKTTTDNKGESYLLVPLGDSYIVSSEYFKNFGVRTIEPEQSLYQVDVSLLYISSVEYIRRKAEEERLLKERELEWERRKTEYEKFFQTKSSISSFNYQPIRDTVFTSVLNRNKHWKNKLIIIDVTGSMRPYTDQVKTWYKLNYAQNDPVQFVLFNDGDNCPANKKIIGHTGGIHYCISCDIKTFGDKLEYSRRKGSGGDGPENDLEATIAAINNCSNYTDIILVVDNYSPVKDIELLNQVTKPVKIILCGANNSWVNVDYLDIAYSTKGSVHTIEDDIVNIGNIVDGAKIKIGKNYYILTNGKFVYYKDERK